MTGTLVFHPALPDWLLISLAIICLIVACISVWRNPVSGFFRVIALSALLGLLANPEITLAEKTPLEDIAVIIVDESQSHLLDGRDQIANTASTQLAERLSARLTNLEVQTVSVLGDEETNLIGAISNAIADVPRERLSAVFVITDGQAHDANRTRELLQTVSEFPIHVLTTGRSSEIDRKIRLINAPHYGIVRDSVNISFQIDDLGPDGIPISRFSQAIVTLRIDGQEAIRQPVQIGTEVSFDAPLDRPGELIIELEVEAINGELTTRNNITVLPITAIRDRLRVLLISGEPHPGERVWRNLLKSDPAIDLVHFTILRPLEKNDGAIQRELALIEFPQDELFIEKLAEFDLLIFDRYTFRGVLNAFHFDNIARYVENGGAVLVASGPEYNGPLSLAARRNLSFILPALPRALAVSAPYRPVVSDVGRRHPVTADLPEQSFWGRWLRILPVTKRSGTTLMEGENGEPLLILDRVGNGRVGLFLSDHVWLWARGFDGGGPHAELLRRISHWLMKEPELEEEQLVLNPIGKDLVIERRTLENKAPPLEVTFPSGDVRTLALEQKSQGVFSVQLSDAPRGLYRAQSGDLFAIGAMGIAAAPEFLDVVSAPSKLQPVTELSGGGSFLIRNGDNVSLPAVRRVRGSTVQRAGSGWAGIVGRNADRVDAVRSAPLAPPWFWLILIATAVILGWLIEGRGGKIRPTQN